MAVIEGQIESLKKLKEVLHQNGITRFNSVGEITHFIKNFEIEKSELPKVIENELDIEINKLHLDFAKYQQDYNDIKDEVTNEINFKITELDKEIELTKDKVKNSFINKIYYYTKSKILKNKKSSLQKNFEKIVHEKTYQGKINFNRIKEKLNDYITNRDTLISERCLLSAQKLDRTKEVIGSLYNLIAGTLGENSVIKEVQKLPDNYHLFNDFSVEFTPPIYNKNEDDRIYSIQIDHLLICEAGVFILETKNWSKQSVNNIDLRSPVKQILRSSYALFVLLNSQSQNSINLECHHWGYKQVPVRNLLVMTNAKPKEKFKHVKVLSLKELNRYVAYFDPIFTSSEVKSIYNFLRLRTTRAYY
ncbi:TPA: NERD domain-containing protein [Legionella pneumophila]|nr:NERD domain-containing protein [Legionella pneumophila]